MDESKVVPPTSEARKGTIEISEHLIRLVSLLDRLNFQIVELSLAGLEYKAGKGGSLKALRADTTLALATAQAIVELIETDVELIETDTTDAFLSFDEKLQARVYEALTKGLAGAYLDEKKIADIARAIKYVYQVDEFLDRSTEQHDEILRYGDHSLPNELDPYPKYGLSMLTSGLFSGRDPQSHARSLGYGSDSIRQALGTRYVAPMSTIISVPVAFATDRNLDKSFDAESSRARFSDGRGSRHVHFGVANVSIPASHRVGKLERPTLWHLELRENRDCHVVLTECQSLRFGEWAKQARSFVEQSTESSALVFVHGYNVSFDEAILRAAQIGIDLEFKGLISAFSWASHDSVFDYMADEETVELAVPHLVSFLTALKDVVGIKSINIIAHSMGNRAVLRALGDLFRNQRWSADEIVFAAPDVDADRFRLAVDGLRGLCSRYTLYGSSNDQAIAISKRLRGGFPRAGDGGNDILVMNGVDTVDASSTGRNLFGFGHSYFASKRSIISDLQRVVTLPTPVAQRPNLREYSHEGRRYWTVTDH